MTRKEIIQMLRSYRRVRRESELLRNRILKKRDEMYSIRAMVTNSSNVRSGSISDIVEQIIEQIDSLIHHYTKRLSDIQTAEQRVVRLIESVNDTERRSVLFMHYIEGRTYLEIGEKMTYSERSICSRHNEAVSELCERYKDIPADAVLPQTPD